MRLKEAEPPDWGFLSNSELATSAQGAPPSKVGVRIFHPFSRGWEGRGRRQRGTKSCHSPLESPKTTDPVRTHSTKQTWISFQSHLNFFFFSSEQGERIKASQQCERKGTKRRGSQGSTLRENLSSTHCKHYRFSWCWELWAVLMMSPAVELSDTLLPFGFTGNAWQECSSLMCLNLS